MSRQQKSSHEEDDRKRGIRRAMNLLEYKDRTRKELQDKLRQEGFTEEVISEAISYVSSYCYLDDCRYANQYMRCRFSSRSRQQLFQALLRKGVERSDIEQAWAELCEEEEPDEQEIICSLIQKRCQERRELSQQEFRRLQGYLARRGFSWDSIRSAFESLQIISVDNPSKTI